MPGDRGVGYGFPANRVNFRHFFVNPSVACVTLDGGLGNPTGAGAYTTRVFCGGGGAGLVSMSPDSIR